MNERKHELQYRPELKQYLLPTLVYYLKLIELPNLEVETYIRQEMEQNPLLEEITSDDEDFEESEKTQEEKEIEELNFLELLTEKPPVTYEQKELDFAPFENVPAQEEKLYDILMKQAKSTFEDNDMEIAEYIISHIEEDGYLPATVEELAGDEYSIDDIKRIIGKIQCFDPVGCAWHEAREPLLIQLRAAGFDEQSVEYIIVRDHLKELQGNHPKELMKKLNIDEFTFMKAKETIMKLDPKPGWRYSGSPSRYINPDFTICWEDDTLCAHLCEDNPPQIRVRRHYLDVLKNRKNTPKEELNFVRKKIQAAQNLLIAIEQRRKTLNRIINGILEYQRGFFKHGYNYLKPLTMTEFARQLNVNPSTISRAIANKYLESPWGIHKVKFFFTAAVGHTDKRIIFKKIKDIVDNEDKTSPLSDTQIVKKLSRDGIIISRRTVSKYRDILKIPAHQYRRE